MDDLKVIQERWERHQVRKEKENKDFGKMEVYKTCLDLIQKRGF